MRTGATANKLRSVLRDAAGPERVHAADIVFELCEKQWLSTLPELKQGEGFEGGRGERRRASSSVVEGAGCECGAISRARVRLIQPRRRVRSDPARARPADTAAPRAALSSLALAPYHSSARPARRRHSVERFLTSANEKGVPAAFLMPWRCSRGVLPSSH